MQLEGNQRNMSLLGFKSARLKNFLMLLAIVFGIAFYLK